MVGIPMAERPSPPIAPPRIEGLRVVNYRALRDVRFEPLTALSVFLGPNGSGKSTVFDVFAFLSECFTVGLRRAWDRRNRFRELRSRGAEGPIRITLKYREAQMPICTYQIAIDERDSGPIVAEESLRWRRKPNGRPYNFLDFRNGAGLVISGDMPEETDTRIEESLESPEMFAVNTLGQFTKHPRVSALRRFITGWHLSYLTADSTRAVPEAGPQEHLSPTGDNLSNVIQFLQERHPDRLEEILRILTLRVPRLESVRTDFLADGRLLLQFKDAPFNRPILSKFVSDGTLKLLAYLTVLHNPDPFPLVGIEEPENHLHPRLLPELVGECRAASASTQLMVTTHSPFFVNGLRPEEVWVLSRDESGYTRAKRPFDMEGVRHFMDEGAQLGFLWTQGFFEFGDPLTPSGDPSDVSRGG